MKPVPPYSPQEYALFFQRGEEKGFAWAFRDFYPALSLFGYKLTEDQQAAEEIAAEAFMKIWKHHKRFSTPGSIRAYLYQIVRNDSLKWRKRALKRRQEAEGAASFFPDRVEDHFRHLVDAETARQLQQHLRELSPQCSQVVMLLYYEGKTVKEIAEELALSVSTVKTQKARGLNHLRKKVSLLLSLAVWTFKIFS